MPGISQIVRETNSKNKTLILPQKEFFITQEEFIAKIAGFKNGKIRIRTDSNIVYTIFEFDNLNLSFNHNRGQIGVSYYHRLTDEIIVLCAKLAEDLNAFMLTGRFRSSDVFPNKITIAAKKRHSIVKKKRIRYHKRSFGGYTTWLVIQGGLDEAISFFKLKNITKMKWEKGINELEQGNGVFFFEYKNWTFLAGNIGRFFKTESKETEELNEKDNLKQLLAWGKKFPDIQYYNYYNRSTYVSIFYRILNGTLYYGSYCTETYQVEYGVSPKEFETLPDSDLNTIAGAWSMDPDEFCYLDEFKNKKVLFSELESTFSIFLRNFGES